MRWLTNHISWTRLCVAAMSGSPASVQMDEVRRRSESVLSVSGSAQDVKADVQTMAGLSLPPSEKYRHLGVEAMLRENTTGGSRLEVKSAFLNQLCGAHKVEGRDHLGEEIYSPKKCNNCFLCHVTNNLTHIQHVMTEVIQHWGFLSDDTKFSLSFRSRSPWADLSRPWASWRSTAVTWRVPPGRATGGASSTTTPSSEPQWMPSGWERRLLFFLLLDVLVRFCHIGCRRRPQGGRRVLYLYGYTSKQIDGLSFPDDVAEPDKEKVAAVTLEVMTVRSEVDMLLKVSRCVSERLFSLQPHPLSPRSTSCVSVCSGRSSSSRILPGHYPVHRPAGVSAPPSFQGLQYA